MTAGASLQQQLPSFSSISAHGCCLAPWLYLCVWGGKIALPYHSRAENPQNTPRRGGCRLRKCQVPLACSFQIYFCTVLTQPCPHRLWEPCHQFTSPVCLPTAFQNTRKTDFALSLLGYVMPPRPSMLRMFCCFLKQDSCFEKQHHAITDAQSRSQGLLPQSPWLQVPGAAFHKG